ncbi:MAG: T9SS type A sorting domain-containing protein [Candidatus Aegiribacteria sp.]|nr:T9SS type A sorting domain-containing protein [Candidatus Aegiribacteria sp.]
MKSTNSKKFFPVFILVIILFSLPCSITGAGFEIESRQNDFEWVLVDSINASIRIPSGERCVITYINSSGTLLFEPPESGLTAMALDAIERAPDWLQVDLEDNLSRLSAYYQDIYADIILQASDPYVDEIAFEIAHMATQTLSSPLFHPEVLSFNVSLLYDTDEFLSYADIIDYGTASGGGDYYSTIEYKVFETDTLYLELPRDIYYWFVVHPKLHRERPNYINPATGGYAAPPTGVFWRDYLFNHADSGYPLLKDSLSVCKTLWNCTEDTLDNGAIGALTEWVTDVMWFNSHTHHNQPVRIYSWHEGTCSVHSYLTSAASRTAFIPATIAVMYRNDHKINEFWEREWIAWEPVGMHINSPRDYDPGWGWDMACVFDWRGDGYTWNATEKYTDVCTLTVNVTDNLGNPVDGACIVLDSDGYPGPRCLVDYTASSGTGQYLFGDNRPLYMKVTSSIGNFPASGNYTVTSSTVIGDHYTVDVSLSGEVDWLDISPDSPPGSPTDDFRIVIEYDVSGETVYGTNLDDSDVYSETFSPGIVDFFICDEGSYSDYTGGDPFEAFEIAENTFIDSVDFIIPSDEQYSSVISNESSLNVTQRINLTAYLYVDQTGITEQTEIGGVSSMCFNNIYPNPFTSSASISFYLGGLSSTEAKIEVYDMNGRMISVLADDLLNPGNHIVSWDGRDDNGVPVPSGIYFCRGITNAGNSDSARLVLLR